MVLNITEHST